MTKETNLIYLILKRANEVNEANEVDDLWGLLATEVVFCCLNVVFGKFFMLL